MENFNILWSILLLTFFSLGNHYDLQGQCPTGNVTLTTQAQVDNFSTLYPNCTHLPGSLTIGPSSDIVNLNGLNGLEEIGGGLSIISNIILEDMSGLSGLNFIGSKIFVEDNQLLQTVNLALVKSTNLQFINIHNNPVLITFHAPEKVPTLSQSLSIYNNTNLEIITGFDNLNSIGGSFLISNTKTTEFPDFSGLSFIGGYIQVNGNSNLEVIDLRNVSSINMQYISIVSNSSLQAFHAPEHVPSLSQSLSI
ncbi:MAG: hypothetical protein R2784_21085, partial [Saprospiraceae bacterium]